MTKQEQIEEMAKIIDNRLIEARGYLGSMNKGEGYWIAQKLIEHYQPKLPEGAVVLTKEDLQKYAKDCLIGEVAGYDILQMAFERAKRWRDDARKETAKEIFNALGNILVGGLTTKLKNYPQFNEVCKKYGVEEEE